MYTKTNKITQDTGDAMPAAASGVKVQRKLSIGAVNDPLEYEADAVADKVMSMQQLPVSGSAVNAGLQRKCAHCEEEEQLQRKPLSSFIQKKEAAAGVTASEAVSDQINAGRGSGSPMDSNTLSFMESRFGTDFSNVKIHTGGEAIQLSRELNAKAFTTGNDIYFNEGQYNPGSAAGKHLLAHELTHTVQQSRGIPSVQRKIRVDAGLTLDTKGFTVTKTGDDYTCPKVVKNSVWNEIFTGLLHSPRIFKLEGKTNAAVDESLLKQMTARMGIVDFASKKKYAFGAGAASKVNTKYWDGPLKLKPGADRQEALDDLNIHPKDYAIACLAATTMTMVGGAKSNYIQQTTSDGADWIPGDWGYIKNMKFSGKPEDIGLEGENIIYVGKDKYWGHFTGANTYRTFAEWFDEVKGWNGEAQTLDYRRIPLVGLE
ncbi:MAG: DUF4157 domain-containing protein [Bacteroidetes bacterium]|nr:DUF4157 domain-containing protein [Bacteroidota bacterium]